MTTFISDESFKGLDFTIQRLPKADYENCIFESCNFSDGYLDNQNFMECSFLECNLSNTNVANTQFKEVLFDHCKIMGVKFEDASDFLMDFTFEHCALQLSSFRALNLKKTRFLNCKLNEVDFTKTDLTASVFEKCDLERATFEHTILEKVDFTTAFNFNIDPEINRLKNAAFTLKELPKLLRKYQLQIKD